MTASVQTKRNKYYIVLNWQDDGGRKQKWIGTDLQVDKNNKRKAEQKRIEILNEWQDKITLNNNDMLFSDFLKQWLEVSKNTISKNTYYSYRQTVYNSICPYFASKKIKLCDLKSYHIQDFYGLKIKNDGVSANTIHHYHANIHKALNYAVKTERLYHNPADNIELPKKAKHIADHYTVEELKVLLDKVKGTNLETVVLLAAYFGLRRGEIIGLKWDCIDFDNNTLSIFGTVKDKGESGAKTKNLRYEPTTKTLSSLRTFPMPKNLAEYLKKIKEKQLKQQLKNKFYNHSWDDFVCVRDNGDLIPLEYVTRTFPKFCEQCGLKRIKLHELRHTNISLLLESGASVKELQEWAGHSSYSTTANIYAHIQVQSKYKLADSMEKIIC